MLYMKASKDKAIELMNTYCNGNYNQFARELGVPASNLHTFLTKGIGGGPKVAAAIINFCESKGLNASEYYIQVETQQKPPKKYHQSVTMHTDRKKLIDLMNNYCNGSYNSFARELGLDPGHLHRYMTKGIGGGNKLVGAVIRFCMGKGLDIQNYIKF